MTNSFFFATLSLLLPYLLSVADVNDNPPLFDRQEYKENVKQDSPIGTNILRGKFDFNLKKRNKIYSSFLTILNDAKDKLS